MKSRALLLLLFFGVVLAMPARVYAHVGSKDVFQQVSAGPYKLFVTIRTPEVIPGVAVVEVRTSGPAVQALRITPVPMTGEASKHPPTPDSMKQSAADPAFFSGSVWLMASGSWKVQLSVQGAAGAAEAGVPVPALPLAMLRMDRPMGMILGGLGIFLTIGIAGIVAAATRESRLPPGTAPTEGRRKRAWVMGGVALAATVVAVWLGGWWWNVEAADYAAAVYRPLQLSPALKGSTLELNIARDPSTSVRRRRSNTDLLLDHGHPMHLYAIRDGEMDAVYHLHPAVTGEGVLSTALPNMPAGHYRLFADIVHKSGLPETLTSAVDIPPGFTGKPLDAEDAAAAPPALSAGELGADSKLPDGYTMHWDKPATLLAGQPAVFRFSLLDAAGKPAPDMQPYLGMAGHAAFVKTDWTVFAHTHPEGSAPMPSVMLANAGSMSMADEPVSATVEFPYGFPTAGRYRIFVQMKHGNTVETGVFDANVR